MVEQLPAADYCAVEAEVRAPLAEDRDERVLAEEGNERPMECEVQTW